MSDFYKEFKEKIDREAFNRGISQREAFFTEVTDLLIEAKSCKDAIHFHYERPTMGAKMGIQIDGYGGSPSEDQNVLTIFVIDYSFSEEVEILNKDELIRTLKKGANFINQIESSLFRNSLEETSEEFHICNELCHQLDSISGYEIIFLTNKSERTRIKEHDIKARNEICRISVIDIEQIEKLSKGQNIQEDIIIENLAIPVLAADFDIEDGDTVIFCFGEIDCRCHIWKHRSKGYKNVINSLVNEYFAAIIKSTEKLRRDSVYIQSVVPAIRRKQQLHNEVKELPFLGKDEDRKKYVEYMNYSLKKSCKKHGFIFFDVYDFYSDEDGFLDYTLSDRSVHIGDPKFIKQRLIEIFKSDWKIDLFI